MCKKILLFIATLISAALATHAQSTDTNLQVQARAGLSVGGAMPFGMPATIRGLDKYTMVFNPLIELDAVGSFGGRWGVLAGLRVERKAMDITARVKNYHITIVRGGESLSGMFTGRNQTSESQWTLSIPVNAYFTVSKVSLFAGPYLAYVFARQFEGSAFDGYLRVNDPTGPKVLLGTAPEDRGTYDFSSEMRRLQFGLQLGADWHISSQWGAFVLLQCGLTGIHRGSFHTIEQTLHPVFASVGVIYNIK